MAEFAIGALLTLFTIAPVSYYYWKKENSLTNALRIQLTKVC